MPPNSHQPLLRDVLATLYPRDADTRRVARDAGLSETRIAFDSTAINTWSAILLEAQKQGLLENIIAIALKEYPTNAPLLDAVGTYRESTVALTVAALQPLRSNRQHLSIDLQVIDRGLGVLAGLMQVPEVLTTVAAFHADFMATARQIEIMGDYKEVHDKLHQLQFLCYNAIVTQSTRFPDDADTVQILMDHELTFQGILVRLQEVAVRPTMPGDELSWIQDLTQAQANLARAIETRDSVQLKQWCRLVRRVLDRYPSYINARLNASARTLRMEAIVQAMTAIGHTLSGLHVNADQAKAFQLSVSSLADLTVRLAALMEDHDRWQHADIQFRLIEAWIDREFEELEMSWPDLQVKISQLIHDESEEWVKNLRRNAATLDQAMADHDPAKIRLCFGRYRRIAAARFFQVDTELKHLCDQLRAIGAPLDAVAQIITVGMPQSHPLT